jgi:hypothetical protein
MRQKYLCKNRRDDGLTQIAICMGSGRAKRHAAVQRYELFALDSGSEPNGTSLAKEDQERRRRFGTVQRALVS